MRPLRLVPVLLIATGFFATGAVAAESAPIPIPIGDREVVVIYGDSITEQNLYAAFIESFLLTRFPEKDLKIYNFGWSGDSAHGGNERFARDVMPVKPTLVTVDFGMNDGRYTSGPDQGIREAYLAAQRRLAATIKAAGAREILLTTSPIDYDRRTDKDAYNEALALMADGVLALGRELGLPTADVFHPMREVQKKAKAATPGFTMIPDAVHPDPVGHLVMAYQVLRRLDVPKNVGSIAISDGKSVVSGGATIANLKTDAATVNFDLNLKFLPCPVPASARSALELVPFQQELNRLGLTVAGLTASVSYGLSVDGEEVASFTGAQLAAGVDLALLDKAPWSVAANRVWELGQQRWVHHFDGWRHLGMTSDPLLKTLPATAALVKATGDYVDALGTAMRQAAKPGTWKVSLGRSGALAVSSLELVAPITASGDFATRYAPETAPETVIWKLVPFTGVIDYLQTFGKIDDSVIYARVVANADRDCVLNLAMGSDDGLEVILNGTPIFTNNVSRGVQPGQDQVEAKLVKGRNTLLFRVSQGGGGCGFALTAKVIGDAVVNQVMPQAKP